VAVIVPIRDVSLYSTGANLANQVRSLLGNVLYPAGVRLAAIYGAEGDEATFVAYRKLQNNWVKMTTGVFFVAIGASVFVMESWLGQKFQLAGIVCVILLAGYMVNMLTGMLTLYLNAIGRPGVEARYGVVSMVVNLVLTVPLAFIGLLGVAAAAAIGTTVGSAYLLATARRRVRQEIPSYLRSAPWLRGIVAAGVAAAGCVAMRTLINVQGPLGLIVCGVAASPALALYAVLVLGPRRAIGDGGAGIRRLLRPPRHAALSGRRSSVRNSTGSVRPRRRPGRHFLPNGSEPLKP
jgi:O-antigen/teichoic acid export membrane protein